MVELDEDGGGDAASKRETSEVISIDFDDDDGIEDVIVVVSGFKTAMMLFNDLSDVVVAKDLASVIFADVRSEAAFATGSAALSHDGTSSGVVVAETMVSQSSGAFTTFLSFS